MIEPSITLAGFLVGFVVGLTGMGGGALMTPILVLFFGIEPLAAVSSDIVASLVMKPVGGGVHWRRGTVHTGLVKWLVLGSVPAAFVGVLILRSAGTGPELQAYVKRALGVALLVVVAGLVIRPLLVRSRIGEGQQRLVVKKLPTLLIGILGGLIVGVTSVGSGSLMIVMLLLLYPRLRLADLVGTDLVQAIPLVASAALGHALFGELQVGLTASILVGSVPGVYLAARLSARAPDYAIRPALMVVLTGTSLKLLGAPTPLVAAAVGGVVAVGGAQLLSGLRKARARAAELQPKAGPAPDRTGGGEPPLAPEIVDPVSSVTLPHASP